MDVKLVGIDGALNDVFAEAIDAGDENHVGKAGFSIEREDDAAGGAIGSHHLHYADGQRDSEMIESIVDPIRNGAVGEDRREAPTTRFKKRVGAAHVEEAFMLAGKARIG